MGLDMYLYRAVKEPNGQSPQLALLPTTWRKNWALHEYIDKTFGGNGRNPLEIELSREEVGRIIEALRSGELQAEPDDLRKFENAAEWLAADDPAGTRLLVYCGDW